MANNVVPMSGKVPARLAKRLGGLEANDDLSSGVTGGFGVMSIRGSKWRIKAGGEETPIVDKDGDPISSIRVLIIKGSPNISKNFYLKKFTEGSNEAPDCYSMDGVTPDPSSPHLQAKTCAACPKNVFGSRISESGKKAKACGDSRRLAVVPEGDFANEQFGGPMLLRVPATSLGDLANYGKATKAKGYPYNTIITRVGFDMETAYPKLTFKAVRPLSGDEEDTVLELLDNAEFMAKVENILAKPLEYEAAPPAEAAEEEEEEEAGGEQDDLFEEPAPAAKKKAKPTMAPVADDDEDDDEEEEAPPPPQRSKKKTAAKKKAAAKKSPTKAPEPEGEDDDMDDDLDDILSSLDNLE